jgi:chromosomal replication initiator protein
MRAVPPPAQPARFSGRATLRIVARHFGLAPAAVAGNARLHRLVVARWIVMHICVEAGGYSAAQAGRLLGRDHTTVLYALRQLATLLARDPALADAVARLTRRCAPDDAPATAAGVGA